MYFACQGVFFGAAILTHIVNHAGHAQFPAYEFTGFAAPFGLLPFGQTGKDLYYRRVCKGLRPSH